MRRVRSGAVRNATIDSTSRMIRRSRIAAVPVIALLFAVAALTGCGGSGDKGASPETSSADLTGYWVFAGEQSIAPGYVLRVTSTSDGYLVEPSVLQGIRWSAASRDGEALAARATGPGGATYDVRLEPSGAGAKLTVSPTQGDGQALFEADLARPSGDYADTAAKFAATLAQAQESAVEEGIHNLQIGVQSWMVDHNDRTPPLAVVRPNGGLQSYLDVWPTNPYSGKPMRPGTDPGQYTYERIDTGRDYRLTGHLEGGGDFTVP